MPRWRSVARRSGSRSPSMIARRMRWPVSPAVGDHRVGLTFISVSAFCMCRTQRERSPVSRLIGVRRSAAGKPRRPDGTLPAAGRRTSAARSTGSPLLRPPLLRLAAARASPRSPRAPASRRPLSMEVDSIATLVTPHDANAAISSRSRVKAPNERTGSVRRVDRHEMRSLPMSIPAQSGFTTLRRWVLRDLRAMEHPPGFISVASPCSKSHSLERGRGKPAPSVTEATADQA